MSLGSPLAPSAPTGSPLSPGSDPLGGQTPFGFEIPQGDPGEIQAAGAQMKTQATAFETAANQARAGAQIATGGWQGAAEATFSDCAARIVTVLSNNADALSRAAAAMALLSQVLSHAQQVCRQAAAACGDEQRQASTAQTQADQHSQDEQNYTQQASSPTVHPAQQSQLTGLAQQARDQATAAQHAADDANDRLQQAKIRGQSAQREYDQDAARLASEISGAADRIANVPEPAGGAPIPIHVTAADRSLAAMLVSITSSVDPDRCASSADQISQRFGPINPGTALAYQRELAAHQRQAEKNAQPQKGNLVDALGGAVSGLTGAHLFGNEHTEMYQDEDKVLGIASMLPVDPEGFARGGEELVERVAVDAGDHSEGADRVLRYGDQPSPRPDGTQAHHIFQEAAFRDVPGYSSRDAPSILLGREEHLQATTFQREAPIGGTVGAERTVAIQSLIRAGENPVEAQRIVDEAQKYPTDELGLTLDSPVRVPRRPHFKP